jgi:predicted RNase H-like nuclease (RuvC/YqgF family)
MTAEQITTIIVAVIGSGVLSAIVTSIAVRRKTSSEAEHNLANAAKILMEAAEKRIASLCERVDKLEKQVTALQDSLQERDNVIDKLEDENRSLREQLTQQESEMVKIRRENESLRKRIKELETQVFQLSRSKTE